MSVSSGAVVTDAGAQEHGQPHHHVESNTGLNNEWFAMVLFLVSEAIIFGALFAQYFYVRAISPVWPPPAGLPPDFHGVPSFPLPLILTLILAASGFTAHWAQTAIRRDDRDSFAGWLAVTIGLGVVFLGGQAYEYWELISHEQFGINSGIYGTIFYMLTGLHGLHVTAGVILLGGVLLRAAMGHFSARSHFGAEGTILYWHFVDIVWFLLYFTLYLL